MEPVTGRFSKLVVDGGWPEGRGCSSPNIYGDCYNFYNVVLSLLMMKIIIIADGVLAEG